MVKQLKKLHRWSVGRIRSKRVSPRDQPGDVRTDRAGARRHARRCRQLPRKAAKAAFPEWRSTPVLSRAQYMYRFKQLLEDRFEELVKNSGRKRTAKPATRRAAKCGAASKASISRSASRRSCAATRSRTSAAVSTRQQSASPSASSRRSRRSTSRIWFRSGFCRRAITCGNTFIVKPSPQTPLSMDIPLRTARRTRPAGRRGQSGTRRQGSLDCRDGASRYCRSVVRRIRRPSPKIALLKPAPNRASACRRRAARRTTSPSCPTPIFRRVSPTLSGRHSAAQVSAASPDRCSWQSAMPTSRSKPNWSSARRRCASATGWTKRRRWARSSRSRRVSASRR